MDNLTIIETNGPDNAPVAASRALAARQVNAALRTAIAAGAAAGAAIAVRQHAQAMLQASGARIVESQFDKSMRQLDEALAGRGSLREAYIGITGDVSGTGLIEDCDRTRLRECAAALGISESIDTSAWSAALTAAVNKKTLEYYNTRDIYDAWRPITRIAPGVTDFKTQTRVRIGGYGALPTVNQGAAYLPLQSPGEEVASYALHKRGGTEEITLEAIKNDDASAIAEIPKRLAVAAKRTLCELLLDPIRTNALAHDGVALYHATHGNLFAGAFSSVQFGAHHSAMRKQTELSSNRRMNLTPAFVLVPFDLEETAYNAFIQGAENELKFMSKRRPEIVPVWCWTDSDDWATFADPSQCATIEVAFMNEQENPEILAQDAPTVGSLFTNDKIALKIRHIYGYTLLDYRGTTKAIVP